MAAWGSGADSRLNVCDPLVRAIRRGSLQRFRWGNSAYAWREIDVPAAGDAVEAWLTLARQVSAVRQVCAQKYVDVFRKRRVATAARVTGVNPCL